MSEIAIDEPKAKELYPYQKEAIDTIFRIISDTPENKNILFQLPTGGGKTFIFSHITKRFLETYHKKILILTHRIELSKQTRGVLEDLGIATKIVNSEVKDLSDQSDYQCFIALVETLNNRLQENENFIENIGLVIVDEAHYNSFRKIFQYFEHIRILGVTATPLSSNKKLPLYDTYSELIIGEQISNLIGMGYLCEGITYSYDVNLSSLKVGSNGEFTTASSEVLYSNAFMQSKLLQSYEEVGMNTKTLIFNSGIMTSRAVYELFKKKNYPVKHLDSTFSDKDRYDTLEWFRNTPNGILTSVSILTTGFDEPSVETVILNRATKSLTLYHQMIGRASRILPIKKKFNIIDLGNNSRRFGLWQAPIDWKHVFAAPHLYIEQRYKDEWDYELEHEYVLPDAIKERFLNSAIEDFNLKDKYTQAVKAGKKTITVIDDSIESHFALVRDNASDFDEAMELFFYLSEEISHRCKLYCKCINATQNFYEWIFSNYKSKIRSRLYNWFA